MADMTEYEVMRSGETYLNPAHTLIALQHDAQQKLASYNAASDFAERGEILHSLLGSYGGGPVLSPVRWEYGTHIHLGRNVFINFECLFLDGADIRIGDMTAVGPRVQFLTSCHPSDPAERDVIDPQTGAFKGVVTFHRPITVGTSCWIGAGAILLGGVTIGDGTTIGAGSVVTRDIPGGVVAAGNPCRVVRGIMR